VFVLLLQSHYRHIRHDERNDFKLTIVAGKRSCLGEQLGRQEAFLFIVSLLQNFDFKPPEGQVRISERGSLGVSYSPTDFNVRMLPRDA